MKTYHSTPDSNGLCVRYWYDPYLRLWTAHVVDGEGNQLGTSRYETSRKHVVLNVSSYDYRHDFYRYHRIKRDELVTTSDE